MRFNEYKYVVSGIGKHHFGINRGGNNHIVLYVPSEMQGATNFPVFLTVDQADELVFKLLQQIREVKYNEF